MSDATDSTAPSGDCEAKLEKIQTLQEEFDSLWLKMSAGDTSNAARYRELRHLLDELRADYRSTCGEFTETSKLPRSVLADWH